MIESSQRMLSTVSAALALAVMTCLFVAQCKVKTEPETAHYGNKEFSLSREVGLLLSDLQTCHCRWFEQHSVECIMPRLSDERSTWQLCSVKSHGSVIEFKICSPPRASALPGCPQGHAPRMRCCSQSPAGVPWTRRKASAASTPERGSGRLHQRRQMPLPLAVLILAANHGPGPQGTS